MGRPAKTTAVIRSEKKSHRTKKELETRKNAEKSVLTGEKMRENKAVKSNAAAHAHWGRVQKLMAKIGRDDAIHENVINRYCLLLAEAEELERARMELTERRDAQRERFDNGEITAEEYTGLDKLLFEQQLKADATLERKRSMLLNIEKENLLTVASGLRAVPKKEAEEEADPMAAMLLMRPRIMKEG